MLSNFFYSVDSFAFTCLALDLCIAQKGGVEFILETSEEG